MDIRASRKDVIWSYLGYFLRLASSFIVLPFTLRFVNEMELGLWYAFLSVGTFVNLLDFGYSNVIVKNITYAWCGAKEVKGEGFSDPIEANQPNYKLFVNIYYANKYVNLIVSLMALLISLSIGSIYIHSISSDMSGNRHLFAWAVYCFGIFANIYYNYIICALKGIGDIQRAEKAVVVSRVAHIVCSIVGLTSGLGILAMAIANVASGIVLRIASKHYLLANAEVNSAIREHKRQLRAADVKDTVKSIWVNAKKVGLTMVCSFATRQTITLLSAAYVGLGDTASYGLANQMATMLAGVCQIYFYALLPQITAQRVAQKKEELKKTVSVSYTSYWLVYILGALVLIVAGAPILKLIRSNTSLPLPLLIFTLVWVFFDYNTTMAYVVITTANVVPYVRSSCVSSVLVVLLSFLACLLGTGIWGMLAANFAVQILYNYWRWPLYVMRDVGLTVKTAFAMGLTELKTFAKGMKAARARRF